MKKNSTTWSIVIVVAFITFTAYAARLLINNGLLQSNLDGGGFSITNVNNYVGTNAFLSNTFSTNILATTTITNKGNLWQESGAVFEDRITFLANAAIQINTVNPTFGYVLQNNPGFTTLFLNSAGSFYGTMQNDGADTWSLGFSPTLSSAVLGTPVFTWKGNNTAYVNSNLFTTNLTAQSGITNKGLLSAIVYDDANGGQQAATSAQIQSAFGGLVLTNFWTDTAPKILLSNQLYLASLTNNLVAGRVFTADTDLTSWSATPTYTNAYFHAGGREFGVGYPRAITFGYRGPNDSFPPGAMTFEETDAANRTKGRIVFWTRDVTTDTAASQRLAVEPSGQLTVWGQVQASNNIIVDAAHYIYVSNSTPSHVAIINGATTITNSGLGATPINGDTTATTFPQIQALAPGLILTNSGQITQFYFTTNNFPAAPGAIAVDFRFARQYIITNASFTIAGFINASNGVENAVLVSVSNSANAGITVTLPAGIRNFGTNTQTTIPIPAGKVSKLPFSRDNFGTNLYPMFTQNN